MLNSNSTHWAAHRVRCHSKHNFKKVQTALVTRFVISWRKGFFRWHFPFSISRRRRTANHKRHRILEEAQLQIQMQLKNRNRGSNIHRYRYSHVYLQMQRQIPASKYTLQVGVSGGEGGVAGGAGGLLKEMLFPQRKVAHLNSASGKSKGVSVDNFQNSTIKK